MFSKELEEVIEAALADGVITEKECAVLHKRVQAEGGGPDELDVAQHGRACLKFRNLSAYHCLQTAICIAKQI